MYKRNSTLRMFCKTTFKALVQSQRLDWSQNKWKGAYYMLDEQNQLWSVYFVCQWNLSVNKVVKKKWLSWGICYFISNVTRLQSVSYECKKTKGVLLSPYGWVGKQCWHPNLWIRWLKKEAMQEFQSDSVGVSSTNFNLSDLDFEVGGQRSSFLKILWMR